jgi:predicted nucleic acid-binding protein
MIGGTDIVMPGKTGPDDAKFIRSCLHMLWPEGVYHDAESTTPQCLSEALPSTEAPGDEFLIYSDMDAFKSWATEGATTNNADQMLHVFVESSAITFVVQRAASPVAEMVGQIMADLAFHRALSLLSGPDLPSTQAVKLDAEPDLTWYDALLVALARQYTAQTIPPSDREPSDPTGFELVTRFIRSSKKTTGFSARNYLGDAPHA